jgi:O-antigen/teichoic acid export membrane protein
VKERLLDHLRPLRLDVPTSGSIARRGALSMAGLLAQGGLRFATSWLVGRVAGRAALGVVQSALSTGTLLALLWPTVTGSAASKFLARARGAGNAGEVAAVARHLSRRTMQSVALLAAATVPVWMLLDGGSALSALPVAAFVVAYSGYSYTRGVQFGTGQVERATTWDVISATVGLVAVAAALAAGVRGTALLLPLVLSYAIYTAASWPRGARDTLPRPLRRELDHFVLLGVAGTLASTGFLQLSMLVARAAGDAEEAGQYAAALATATPASLVAVSLSLTLFPSLAESWGRGDAPGFRRQTDQAVRALFVVMVALFGILIVCSRLVMSIWGPEFDPDDPVFPILLMAILSTSLGVATVNALLARSSRGIRVTTSASVAGMVVGLLLWALLVPTLSTLGVALGYLVGAVLIASVPFAVVWWKDEHRWGGLIARLAGGVLVLVAITVAQRVLDPPLWTDPITAVAFLGIWVLLAPVRLATVRDHVRAMRAGDAADG